MFRVPLVISLPGLVDWIPDYQRITSAEVRIESHAELVARLSKLRDGTIRLVHATPEERLQPPEIGNLYVYREPSFANGRLELLTYCREQSMSETVHRYGNILQWDDAR
jgi:RHH-type proline utilization regulon transcriptional repressor/proline dehydrogenase/delta 1-pyrroline-5-carboxylate dehydrogenase